MHCSEEADLYEGAALRDKNFPGESPAMQSHFSNPTHAQINIDM